MDFMSLLCSDYNLDWLPVSEAEIPYSTNNSFPFAPVTPDHAKQFENPPRSEMRNFSGDESSSQDKDKQENMLTSILSDAAHNGCNQLLQDIVDSSFAAISPPLTDFQDIVDSSSAAISPPLTDFQDIVDSSSAGISPPLTEKNITELVDNQGIDLNKTPQQKTPKRRKHRPKVIVEGKPKRTPKAQTPSKTNPENPSGKRKYVRKNLGTTPTQEHKYATDAAPIPTADSSAKSCRRKLDFVDLENGKNGEAQGNANNVQAENNQADGTGFYLNYDSQATRLSTGSDISKEKATLEKIQNPYSGGKQQQVQSMFNRTHSINQMLDGSAQFPKRSFPAAHPTAIRNNTINDIARRLHNNASFIQRAGSNIRNHPQCLLGEFDRMFKQARPSVNLETTALPSRQSTLQNVGGDSVDNNGNGGCRGPYLDAIQQASTSFKNQEGVRVEPTRKFSQVNGPTINLETTVLRSRQSTPQMVGRDIVDYNRNGGRRSSCLNAIPQASPSIKDQELLQGELNRRFIQANGQTINLETKVLPSWQSNPQKVGRDIADYNGNGGCGGPYLNATQQASASFKDQEYLQGEANRRFVQEKGQAINLEPTVQPSQRSTLQKVGRDMADYNGNVGCRVPYLNATKQASPSLYGHDRNDPISGSGCLETRDGNTLHDFHQEVFKDDSRVTEELPQWQLSTSQRNNVRQEACPSFKDQGAKFNYNGMYRDHNIVDQRSISRRSETHDRNRVLNNFPPEMIKEDSRQTATGELPSRQGSLPEIERNGSAVAAYNGTRGVKRPNPNATQRAAISFECWKDLDLSTLKDQRTIDQSSSLGYPETRDRNSFPKDYQPTAVENHFRKVATAGKTTVSPSTWVSRSNGRLSNYQFEGDVTKKLKSGSSNSIQNGQTAFVHDSLVEQRPNRSTQVQDISSTLIGKSNLLPPALPRVRSTPGYKQGTETCTSITSLALKNMASTSLNLPYTDKVRQQENKGTISGNPQIPKKPRGRPRKPQQTVVTVDDITSQLQVLRISSKSEKTHTEEQNALVLYEGYGKLVPYEDPSKKRKPRPKVDLDPDTNRVWKLLMGKEGSEDTEAPDKDKEKWWENERNVFRGRAESFIARMHLVQGDRRFSRWKGSVVDSVIGVFLTQNVSDHLSSSAFMSLAARFPLRVTTTDKECYQSEASILPNEQKNQIPDLNGTMECFEEILRQPVYNRPHPSFHEPRTEDRNSTTGHVVMAEKNVASSSHNSYDAFFLQLNGESQSGVGSNSEDSTSLGRSHVISSPQILSNVQSSFQVFHDPRTDSLCFDDPSTGCHEHQQGILRLNNNLADSTSSHIRASGDHMRQGMDSLGLFRDESIYSLPSTNYGVQRENGIGFLGKGHYEQRMAEAFRQENGVPVTQGRFHLLDQSPLGTNRPPTRPTKLVFTGQTGSSHGVSCGTECSVQAGLSTSEKERAPPAAEKLKSMQTKMVEVINAKEQVISSAATTGTSTDLPNARKGKAAEDDKTKSFDWDILRKNVLAEGKGKVSTSKDAMDSMDYETMRCANVNEISNAIKERGMNNMLAERMKDFLNRLVTDHGSIDLEWLRDVPPDKAKDYLLSIRGLGLKSVECVRLLTLHHLAFPVDTNVGRIAVRLGWVPLQPLPESLQLHLLELYPMLETIQKYLWPRLCKLDQPTLYELHYQMITFGKVFCTKSKPNCNACPMRGECRHFASAFASARLALPGPEEKGIVSSNAPATHYKNPVAAISPIPLLPANNQEHKETGSMRNCEPIVEEPATPEPETEELSLSDIEDAFYEDPDEIPTIKLNVEEFAMNLHNYMQENMELQDGDMSKALVALNPEAPSIPTQKLKNVSRLRTEHQVYELPDSHPLLEGLDKREPDDPTPYLLAIWTPGETPNSIQPPESGCEFQETGNLCDRSTCFSCNSVRESNSQIVRGTILVPCRTAMRGSFPLNGTYFQVNEVFADHESSLRPISVPRSLIWNLPRRTVYFGTSVSTIFKGLSTEGIQFCFWKGFVCVRGFDQKSRAPRPLKARLHFPASAKLPKQRQ